MKNVLFICTGNIYRSKYAEAYFNYVCENTPMFFTSLACVDETELSRSSIIPMSSKVHAISRGTMADQNSAVLGSEPVSTELWNNNINPGHYKTGSSKLTEKDLIEADIIIGMYEPEHRPQLKKIKTKDSPYIPDGDWDPSWADKAEYWMVPDQHRYGEVLDFHVEAEEGLRIIEENVRKLVKSI